MKLTNITKRYKNRTVLDGLSVEISAGEVVCLMGESGSGKTTLLNILASLTDYTGEIEGKGKVSYLFQDARLIPTCSAKENLTFVGADETTAETLLKTVEIETASGVESGKLSGGEKQRVALARAISVPYELLLLDEPFSALDTARKIRMIDVLKDSLQKNKSASAIIVTHDVEEALTLADRVILIEKGKIVKDVRLPKQNKESEYGKNPNRDFLLSVLTN